MNTQTSKTLDILRGLYKRGNQIVSRTDSSRSQDFNDTEQDPVVWVSEVLVCFEYLFYNSKYLNELRSKIPIDNSGDIIYDSITLRAMLGHIAGIGKMLKFGYLKDQFAGINNDASQICFVAMSFAPELNSIYSVGIKPAVEALGYEAVRVDTKPHNDKIDSKIIELIMKSRFIVADFTNQRNGVYYEAGFAKGLGLPVIQTCMNADFDKMHFDIRSINTLRYDTPIKLVPILKNQIKETIGSYKPAPSSDIVSDSDIPF